MTFSSWKQCVDKTGISREFLRLAQAKNAPGFNKTSGSSRINWDELEPWIIEHRDELEELIGVSIADLEKIKLQEDIINTQLKNKKLEGEYLDIKETIDFLIKLRLSFESVINGWTGELPPKLVGNKQLGEIENIMNREKYILFNGFGDQIKEKIKECKKQQ